MLWQCAEERRHEKLRLEDGHRQAESDHQAEQYSLALLELVIAPQLIE